MVALLLTWSSDGPATCRVDRWRPIEIIAYAVTVTSVNSLTLLVLQYVFLPSALVATGRFEIALYVTTPTAFDVSPVIVLVSDWHSDASGPRPENRL